MLDDTLGIQVPRTLIFLLHRLRFGACTGEKLSLLKTDGFV